MVPASILLMILGVSLLVGEARLRTHGLLGTFGVGALVGGVAVAVLDSIGVGIVRRPLDPLGHVAIDGELWRARRSWAAADEPPPRAGEVVVMDQVHGLTLAVRRAEVWEVEP